MPRIELLDDKSKSALADPIIDLRDQIKAVYFTYFSERIINPKAEIHFDKEYKDDELWEFAVKSADESLFDFAAANDLTIDELYGLGTNNFRMCKVTLANYHSDSGELFLPYDISLNASSAYDGLYFVCVDQLRVEIENSIQNSIQSIEHHKTVFENSEHTALVKDLIETQNYLDYNAEQTQKIKLEIEDWEATYGVEYTGQSNNEILGKRAHLRTLEAEASRAELHLKQIRRQINGIYEIETSYRKRAMANGNKFKYAIRKKLGTLTGTLDIQSELTLRKGNVAALTLGVPLNLVVETIGIDKGEKVEIEILQFEKDYLIEKDTKFHFRHDGEYKSKFEVKIGELDAPDKLEKNESKVWLKSDKYRGYNVDYKHTVHYKVVSENSVQKKTAPGEVKVEILSSSINIVPQTADMEERKKWEDKLRTSPTQAYVKVAYSGKEIIYKGDKYKGSSTKNFWFTGKDKLIFQYESLIKKAIEYSLGKFTVELPAIKGRCARYTYNHANKYIMLLKGIRDESLLEGIITGKGHANREDYFSNLVDLGYKREETLTLKREALIDKIEKGSYEIGDVIVYWTTDNNVSGSHKLYGHTQIFTNGFQSEVPVPFPWATDNHTNYGKTEVEGSGRFIYGGRKGENWKFIVFRVPKI